MDLATDFSDLSPRAVTRNSRRSQPTRSVCAITPCLRVLLLCVLVMMCFARCVQAAPQSSRQCRLSRGSVGPLQKRLSYFLSVIVGAQRYFFLLTWTLAAYRQRSVQVTEVCGYWCGSSLRATAHGWSQRSIDVNKCIGYNSVALAALLALLAQVCLLLASVFTMPLARSQLVRADDEARKAKRTRQD